jgi:DNA polymerase-1
MQGTAADIIKIAMGSVQDWLAGADLDARMILQVHDELVFEVNDKDLQALTEEVVQRMCGAVRLSVPLTVATGVGMNWDEAH